MFALLALFFLYCPDVLGHPLCYDGSYPSAQSTLQYCTEYVTLSCCSPTREQQVISSFLSSNSGKFSSGFSLTNPSTWSSCDRELIKVACTRCSQYEAHLYETSALLPILCQSRYCSTTLAAACPALNCAAVGIVSSDPWCYPVIDPPLPTSVAGLADAFPLVKFVAPIDISWTPGDSNAAYVASQTGVVSRVAAGTSRVFMDVSARTNVQGELGFLAFQFDPDYATNCYAYAFYTVAGSNSDKINTLSRFYVPNCASVSTAIVDTSISPGTECKLVQIRKTTNNHNGGSIQFDSHGDLYLSIGDGGTQNDGSNNGQNTYNLFGSMIRITPGRPVNPYSCSGASNYTIPNTNPFINGGGLPEIYAYGLRNPWVCRISQPGDKLYCGDVGQQRYESMPRIGLGDNLGWSVAEGDGKFSQSSDADYATLLATSNYRRPLADYRHSGQYPLHERTVENLIGFSITYGGPYYGNTLNAKYRGGHIFADFYEFTVGIVFVDETGNPPRAATGELIIVESPPISRIRYGPDGEPYFLSYYGTTYPSPVFKFSANKNIFLCGNYRCEIGESCATCPIDCQGVQTGPRNAKWCCADGGCASGSCPVDCSARIKATNPLNKVCEPGESCLTTDDCPGRKNNGEYCCYGTADGPVCASPVNGTEVYNSAYCKSLNEPCARGNSNGRGNGWDWQVCRF